MKKLIKNKCVLLIGSIIIMSILYVVVEKAIDNYNFQSNDGISFEDTKESGEITVENKVGLDNVEDKVEEIINEEVFDDNITESVESQTEDISKATNKIYVYVTGEVNNPGVVIIDERSRIIDAINAAGGITDNANITKVNLVYVLEDGVKVNIPSNNDLKNDSKFEYITVASGDGSDNSVETGSKKSDLGKSTKQTIVNINTATQTELETLPGIGPSLALKIINYRKENGEFSSSEDIKNVSGIGESKFEQLKEYIRV